SQTVRMWQAARQFVAELAARGESMLFVGTKKQARDSVEKQADRAEQFYVVNRWLGGTLTNFRTIQKSIEKLKDLDKMSRDGTYAKYTKKEVLRFERERERLEYNVGGIREMDDLPGAMFIVDPHKEEIAVKEANRLDIPTVALTDTNCDPSVIDFPIPGNDDAIRAIRLFSTAIAEACLHGSQIASAKREESAREAAREAEDFHAPTGESEGPEVQAIGKGEDDEGEPEAEAAEAAEGADESEQSEQTA
ncbi:MAG: 30S ribosomal protein S2, partial [Bradymonadaceae bacterium]